MKKWILILAAMTFALAVPVYAQNDTPAAPKFKDLPVNHWAYEPIMLGVHKGYIKGGTDGTFRPHDSVTVAEFIKMTFMSLTDNSSGFVWWGDQYLAMIPEWYQSSFNSGTVNFEQGSPWYSNYIATAQNLGIISDEYAGRYDEPLTRERAAKILNNVDDIFHGPFSREYAMIAGAQLFKDFNRSDTYFQEYIGDVALRGIMNGNEQGYFNPKATITRAEAAQICMVLADDSLRKKTEVNLAGVPYSTVPLPGYGSMTFVFANEEMKMVYDNMYARQKDYPGATNAYTGQLLYYKNEGFKLKGFEDTFYVNLHEPTTSDFGISFTGNVYTMTISTEIGMFERATDDINYFSSLIFKDSIGEFFTEVKVTLQSARTNKYNQSSKIIEGRQVIINSYTDFINVGISAYQDKI
ncbi:hypothetical protein SD71_18170 [Cohnella kolymensis]|uniref:SLH domain-containing protein n=1 Tax=Cohnella kolymensis TaxID=1590652 RepID=A0ABR5A194_9BACL|nr:S-layer homology domain-containing protein [Cohnella kolymensis]KIL34687.1 hypothetical protein SD71_18170 [Cohnella kolymensis]